MVVPLYVKLQQVPQFGEFQPATAWAPPMNGNFGREPNVVKPFVSRPFAPSEQLTMSREVELLSYVSSYET